MMTDLVMKIIMQATDKASSAFERVRHAASGLTGNLSGLQKELSGLDKAQRLIVHRNQLDAQMQKTSRAILENRREVKALRDEITKSGVPTKAQAAKLAEFAQQSDKLKDAQSKSSDKLSELNSKLKTYGITARDAAGAQAQLNSKHATATAAIEKQKAALDRLRKAQETVSKAKELSGNLKGKATTAAMGAAAVGGTMSVPIKAYAESESAGMELRVAMMNSAGNALRKVFSSMMATAKINKIISDAKKLGQVSADFNLSFTDGKGEFGGLENAYTQLAKLKNLTTETRLDILKSIFGDDAETLQALNTMIDKGQAGYNEFAAKMEAQASLQQRVNATLGTVTNLWDSATGSFTNLMVAVGESMQGEIRTVIGWIDDISTKLGIWAKANPETANTLLKIVGAIGISLVAFAALFAVIAAVLVPMAAMKLAWASLFTSMSGGTGIFTAIGGGIRIVSTALLGFGHVAKAFLVSNPFGWAILAVSLLAALYLNWEKVKNAIAAGWAWLRGILRDNPLIGAFAGPIGMIASLIANFDRLIAKVQAAKHAIAHSSFGQAAAGVWSKVKSVAGFSRGGYTGAGGVNEAAGIVHKGEVVFSQRDVARFGGWQMVERLRQGGANLLAKMGGSSSLNMSAMAVRAAEKLGGIFSGSENKPSVLPRPTVFAPPQIAGMGSLHMGGDNITIHIHATPNQDPRSIADLVLQKLQQRDQAKRRRANSSFMDKD
ncbi:phage tail tape measure protein [Kingella kingae]|nr:phage tail tape measure protein [Kingella kingae]MDK4545460.1 phage tail tape measure protein [Kingella kingae]